MCEICNQNHNHRYTVLYSEYLFWLVLERNRIILGKLQVSHAFSSKLGKAPSHCALAAKQNVRCKLNSCIETKDFYNLKPNSSLLTSNEKFSLSPQRFTSVSNSRKMISNKKIHIQVSNKINNFSSESGIPM